MYWGISIFYEHSVRGNLIGSVIGCIKTMLFINQVTMGSMWYMPVILCLYLILPFVAVLVKRFPVRAFVFPCVMVFLSGMLMPFVSEMSSLSGGNEIVFALKTANLFSFYLLYILAGYWVSEGLLKLVKAPVLVTAGGVLLVLTCVIQLQLFRRPADYVATYDFPLYLPIGICTFELIRRYGGTQGTQTHLFAYISKISFAVYFVHVCIMTFMEKFVDFSAWARPVVLLFFEISSMLLSVFVIWALSHVPFLKKYLFLIKGKTNAEPD